MANLTTFTTKTVKDKIIKAFSLPENVSDDILRQKIRLLIDEYEVNNLSPTQIKMKYGFQYTDFGTFLRRLGCTMRSHKEAVEQTIEWRKKPTKRHPAVENVTWTSYRRRCKFSHTPELWSRMPGYKLLQEKRFYKSKTRKTGVDKDHMFSVYDGYINNVPCEHIYHPANCQFLTHTDNAKKGPKSSITYKQLLERIAMWENAS